MKKITAFLFIISAVITSCSSTGNGIFRKKTPHEKYAEALEDKGLEKTPEGRQWLAVSKTALALPQSVQLPYRHTGIFPSGQPRALGLSFAARQGERLIFTIDKETASRFTLYADLFQLDGGESSLLYADTAAAQFSFDIERTGNYILRLQPELANAGAYSLSIAVGPSLGFPVGDGKGTIGSFWGDGRDGGKRSHEGIDIFAPKRTPAIAAADGVVTSVREGGIGGKTVWLRPAGQSYTLYYAHLDEQLVREGQSVKKGETLGLVGNTGNAATTASHLHFGVYGFSGAVDPFPFVNKTVKTAAVLPDKKLNTLLRLTKAQTWNDSTVKTNTVLTPLAVNSKGYLAALPDGRVMLAPFAVVQAATQPLKKTKATVATVLYAAPARDAVQSIALNAGSALAVLGYFNEYAYVKYGETEGWVLQTELKS